MTRKQKLVAWKIENISIIRMYSYFRIVILKCIRLYQKTTSPDRGIFSFFIFLPVFEQSEHGVCKFRPTCSQYCYEAVEKYGVVRGLIKGIKRIIRCNPWSHGGWDPI